MDLLSIPELAQQMDCAENTVRRYVKRFPEYFHPHVSKNVKRFPVTSLDVLKFISDLYVNQAKKRSEVEQALEEKYGHTVVIEQPEKPVSELISKYGSNTPENQLPVILPEISRLANAFERIATVLENQTTGARSQPTVTENQSIQNKEILTDKETASFLGIADRTLRDWRKQGKGPAYVKMGSKIRYRKKDIDEYLDNQTIKLEKD